MSVEKKARFGIMAPVVWLAMIWGVSSVPSDDFNPPGIVGWDKLAHLGVYSILGYLAFRAFRGRKLSAAMKCLIFALLTLNAALDEYHQRFIPGRSVSVWDLLANCLGLITGLVAGWIARDSGK